MTASRHHELPRSDGVRHPSRFLMHALRPLARAAVCRRHQVGAVHPDLQPASYLMLGHLAEHGPMRSSSIAEVFEIDKGAISRQVQHLVDLGLVDRTPDPADGRATLVSASDDAVRRLAEITAHRRRFLDERLSDWSDEELIGFVEVLGRYNAALD